ncbi:MAG: hypothetical protein H2184_07480 [Candidatus Galacturonibacter soehngenii]|nr:hypothetical protein [Candidatus Galacturonibacter soehngenii]
MKIKKMLLSSLLVLTIIFPTSVANASSINTDTINTDTIITKNNIAQVLQYLKLPSDSIIENTNSDYDSMTVGELQDLITTVSNQTDAIPKENCSISKKNNIFYSSLMAASKGSKSLSTSFDVDSYSIDLSVTGNYSGSKWTGVGGISVDVDSSQFIITYKIASKDLTGTYTSSRIKISGDVYVDAYVGVGEVGLVKIGSAQKNSITAYFYAADYL